MEGNKLREASDLLDRRKFVKAAVGTCATIMAGASAGQRQALAAEQSRELVDIDAHNGDDLQSALNSHTGAGRVLRLKPSSEIHCTVREEIIAGERSDHPLLVPENVHLDLQGSTLFLDCRSNSYGVRLSNNSSIRNGTIKVIRSEGKGSQGCWHSGISVGAAYGHGGTPDKPGHFSTVRNWTIENITINQPFEASAIQLMSEACNGVIRDVTVRDSAKAFVGVGMDWGSVGPITTEDAQVFRMRELWEQKLIYSTHPHDILIENLRVGRLTRNVDGNDAGVRCSACHNITIRNVHVEEAATAVAVFGGDFGYEFAREDLRDFQHTGYRIEDVRIERALLYGIVLNGAADNIYRAHRNLGYDPVRDPVHPGLDRPVLRNITLHGGGERLDRQGIFAVALTEAQLNNLEISNFRLGIHVEDWVKGMRFNNTRFSNNQTDSRIEGATEPASEVTFNDTRT
ncbi:MAG: hypothetical protein IT366_07685 [Candidatus Hydrogenedentes bacterium]|nr:hypothetical protein [Candidatus Hydrogenedentota bacterium]